MAKKVVATLKTGTGKNFTKCIKMVKSDKTARNINTPFSTKDRSHMNSKLLSQIQLHQCLSCPAGFTRNFHISKM